MPGLARKSASPWNFRYKLFAIFTIFTTIISATFTAIYTFKEVQTHRRRSTEKSQLLATILANSARLPLYGGDRGSLRSLAGETAGYPGVKRVVITDTEGKVMAEAGAPFNALTDVEVCNADVTPGLSGNSGGPLFNTPGQDGKPVGKVSVVMDSRELTLAIRSMIVTSTVTALLFWLLITGVSYLVVNWITRSLSPLTAGIRAIRGGDYNFRILATTRDELGDAAEAVNELAAELLKREEENKRLQQDLVNSMKLEMSEERKSMMAKMIQTNRMTSLGLLVSSMAHEINTPNGAIKLAGQQIAKAWKSAIPILDGVAKEEGDFLLGGGEYSMVRDEVLRATDIVGRSSERIGRVIQDLRTFNAGERGEVPVEVSISQVIADAVAIIRAHGSYGKIAIQSRVQQDLPAVIGNRYQLGQVLINLLLNGMQAIPEGKQGCIGIDATVNSERGEVAIAVTDDGEGISPEHLGQLIEPFFSTRLDKGGSGLGLYISNYIVAEHQGRMEFASELGKGTTITIFLPVNSTRKE
jgi:two-component system, NtrC family, sensor kinase